MNTPVIRDNEDVEMVDMNKMALNSLVGMSDVFSEKPESMITFTLL